MKIVADTNTFLAVALEEPEKAKIIQLTRGAGKGKNYSTYERS